MKMFSHLGQYLTIFILEWEMFYAKVVEKIKTRVLYLVTFFRKSRCLWGNVEKYGGAWGATNDVTIWCIHVACWISKATFTHVHPHRHACVCIQICNTAIPWRQWFAKMPLCFVIHCLSCLELQWNLLNPSCDGYTLAVHSDVFIRT